MVLYAELEVDRDIKHRFVDHVFVNGLYVFNYLQVVFVQRVDVYLVHFVGLVLLFLPNYDHQRLLVLGSFQIEDGDVLLLVEAKAVLPRGFELWFLVHFLDDLNVVKRFERFGVVQSYFLVVGDAISVRFV